MNYYQPKRFDLHPNFSQNLSLVSSSDDRKETSIDSSKRSDDSVRKDHGTMDGHIADDEEDGEEPEWLSYPVNRADTIELRGFEDEAAATNTTNDDNESEQSGQAPVSKLKPPARSTPTKRREVKRTVDGSIEFSFDEFSQRRPYEVRILFFMAKFN